MAIGIYKITNKVNGKIYIGQSRNIASRWYQHKLSAKKPPRGDDSHFVRAMKKYGADNFDFEIVENCTVEELNEREVHWISYYNSTDDATGYNYQTGGRQGYNVNVYSFERLSLKQVEEITLLLQDCKLTSNEIAEQYGVTKGTITNINHGHSWIRDGIDYPIRKIRYRRAVPTKDELIESLRHKGFPTTYRFYNTGLVTLKSWCKLYGIPDNHQDFQTWYNAMKKEE